MIQRAHFFPGIEKTSAVGFGTTGLVGMESAAQRARVFAQLLDAGVNHFDTAPYYGYGAAERMLGELSRAHRSRISITTKFGIQPPRLLKSGFVNRLARRILKQVPQVRAALARRAHAATRHGAFSVDDARRSLDGSLQALGTSYIDLFLLHEPAPSDALRDDLVAFLESQVSAGKIKAFGCGGDFKTIAPISHASPQPHPYLQFEDSLTQPRLDDYTRTAKAITFGSITTLPRLLSARLRSNSPLRSAWNEALGLDCSEPANLAGLMMRAAVHRNNEGLVLFSSTNPSNVDALMGALNSSEDTAVADRFWTLARRELSQAQTEPTATASL